MSSRSSQYVEVQLEIGHKATPKTKIGADGHTHDWTVFVRGPESSNIQHFVEKVVFHLHESFPKPKRVVKDPPYQVSESGYASFELPVEVYFKNKEEPKKIAFDYDLYLRLDDAVSHSRREKLTFQNPSNDFKKKLLKAGGVTNETNISGAKSNVVSDEKQSTPQPTSGNPSKPFKPNTSGPESKKAKTLGVIPSKDKSLINSQNSSNVSTNQSSVPERHPNPSSNNKQFTDLFGPPIQARPTSDPKIKENTMKSKFSAIASKGVKTDTKSSHKSSTKKSYSPSPSNKLNESKSSKDLKELNPSKDSKNLVKLKESTKSKREDESALNKSKKKTQSQLQSQSSPKVSEMDKKPDSKGTKKRRNSSSSTSSSLTASSFSGSTESKLHKEEPKIGLLKEKDNKKENKKQKISSKDMNSASGVKKQSSTSTKISFSDNNSSTTIEIKSVKKEKTWDNEVKKSRSKEFKSSEFKAAKDKDKPNPNSSSSLNTNKTKAKSDANCLKSDKVEANKHLKPTKDKHNSNSRPRKRSTSLSSESRLTPALSSPPSNSGPNYSTALDVESHDSSSSLLSEMSLPFKPNRNNEELNSGTNNKRFVISDGSDSDRSEDLNRKNRIVKKDFEQNNKNKTQISNSKNNKRKRDSSKDSNKGDKKTDQTKIEIALTPGPDLNDTLNSSDLKEIQKRINESTNSDLLQAIVDIIEDSGLFSLSKTTFDFDLMKLDDKTIKKLKTYLK